MNLGVVGLDSTVIRTFRQPEFMQVQRIGEESRPFCAAFEHSQTFPRIVTVVTLSYT